MYRIELINKKTNEIKVYDNLTDMNEGETLFIQFEINTLNLDDGEYLIKLYDEDELVATDTLIVGEFDVNGIQYKKGENIYIETKIDVKLQEKTVELTDSTSIVTPDEGFDGYSKLTVNAEGVYNSGYAEGEEDGYTQGKVEGAVEQRNKLETLTVSTNGNYSRTDGYDKVTVDVKPKLQIKDVAVNEIETTVLPDSGNEGISKIYINAQQVYDNGYSVGSSEGASNQKLKMVRKSITTNGNYQREDGYNEVDVNVQSYSYLTNEVDSAGLRQLGWSDDDINYWKDNSMHYEWQNDEYVVTEGNKNIVISNYNDIQTYKDNPDFVFCPYFETSQQGFNVFEGCKYLRGIPTLSLTSVQGAFKGCSSLITIPQLPIPQSSYSADMFNGCCSLTHIPYIDTSSCSNMSRMFYECYSLRSIPQLNTANATDINSMFFNCSSLMGIPFLDTSKVTNISNLFYGCCNLKTIPQLDTSNVEDMYYSFYNCKSLMEIPLIDTKKVTRTSSAFKNCISLKTVPLLDLSSIDKADAMFDGCSALETVQGFDLSKATNISNMFKDCKSLISVPSLKCGNATNVSYLFSGCSALTSIGLLDFSSVTNISTFIGYADNNTLTDLAGFKNLKINWNDVSGLVKCKNLTKQSVINVINNLYDFRGNGDSSTTRTIKFHANSLALLSDDEKAIATNKGWVLSS